MSNIEEFNALLRAQYQLNNNLDNITKKVAQNTENLQQFKMNTPVPTPIFVQEHEIDLSNLWREEEVINPEAIECLLRHAKHKACFQSDEILIIEFLRQNNKLEIRKALVGEERTNLEKFLQVISKIAGPERRILRKMLRNLQCEIESPPREFYMGFKNLFNGNIPS